MRVCIRVFWVPREWFSVALLRLGGGNELSKSTKYYAETRGHSSLAPATQIYADIEVNQLDADSLWHFVVKW